MIRQLLTESMLLAFLAPPSDCYSPVGVSSC